MRAAASLQYIVLINQCFCTFDISSIAHKPFEIQTSYCVLWKLLGKYNNYEYCPIAMNPFVMIVL